MNQNQRKIPQAVIPTSYLNSQRGYRDENLTKFYPSNITGSNTGKSITNYSYRPPSHRDSSKEQTTTQSSSSFSIAEKKSQHIANIPQSKLAYYMKPNRKEREEGQRRDSLAKMKPRSLQNFTSSGNVSRNASFTSINNENINTINTVEFRDSSQKTNNIINKPNLVNSNKNSSKMDISEDNIPVNNDNKKINNLTNNITYLSTDLNSPINNLSINIDPQNVHEYIDDIYDHLKESESHLLASHGYMQNQSDINEKMRAILIDWLVDVHLKFKLTAETLFLTTQIVDRYLEKTELNRNKLQLVGVTALLIASKYEEIYPPDLKDFVYITDKAYTKEEILDMENKILSSLEFNITTPTPLRLLEVFVELCKVKMDDQVLFFAKYLLELFLVEYKMIKYSPSLTAASTLYMTSKVKRFNIIIGSKLDIPLLTGYSEDKLKECAKDICIVLDNADKSSLKAVKNKYCSSKFMEVAKWKK